jgi:hypothetical protein
MEQVGVYAETQLQAQQSYSTTLEALQVSGRIQIRFFSIL